MNRSKMGGLCIVQGVGCIVQGVGCIVQGVGVSCKEWGELFKDGCIVYRAKSGRIVQGVG